MRHMMTPQEAETLGLGSSQRSATPGSLSTIGNPTGAMASTTTASNSHDPRMFVDAGHGRLRLVDRRDCHLGGVRE